MKYKEPKAKSPEYTPVYGRSEFEQTLVKREAMERKAAQVKYTLGIQGRDGGKCVEVKYPHDNLEA